LLLLPLPLTKLNNYTHIIKRENCCLNYCFQISFKLLDTRIAVLVDHVGSRVPVHAGQPGVFDQHRAIAVGQVARQTDYHVQPETRDAQRPVAVVQSPQVVGRKSLAHGLKLCKL